jgi:hypothetical protein
MTRARFTVSFTLTLLFACCALTGLGCSGDKTGRSGAPLPPPLPTPQSLKFAWTAPTQNTSGQPLSVPLAGYTLYYGPNPRTYVDSIDINDPTATEWEDGGAVPPGLWYFALTARDTAGQESDFSNEVSKVVQ